jgi:hydroxymethylglutaryl-CoA synthase
MAAADWVRAGGRRPRRALVIAADIARYDLGSAGEPTQGAGAVAMLVGPDPRVLALSDDSGTYAANVYDFWRPLDRREAIVDGKYSIDCYLAALEGAFRAYRALEDPPLGPDDPLTDRLARLLFHTPFPKMAIKAHRRLVEIDWSAAPARWQAIEPRLDEAVAGSFRAQAARALEAAAAVGNTYTASLYLCLAGLLESEGASLGGRRIGLFSYGSGSCAEYFTGTVPTGVEKVSDCGVASALARRRFVDVAEYERLQRAGGIGGEPPPGFDGEFLFYGERQDRREYGRARRLAA